jgi:hypothetical protein
LAVEICKSGTIWHLMGHYAWWQWLKGFMVWKFGNLYNNCIGGARNLQSGTIIISKGLAMQFHLQFIILQWEIRVVVLFASRTGTLGLEIYKVVL